MAGTGSRLSEKEVAQLKKSFDAFDKDKSGSISVEEMGLVLRTMGQNFSPQQVQEIMDFADRDRTGHINFEEFLKMMEVRMKQPMTEEDLVMAFRAFDRDDNGHITADEMRFAMGQMGEKLTEEELQKIMKAADKNKDGKIDYKEVAGMVTKK